MAADEKFSGKILIADGKVNILEVQSDKRNLQYIEQLITARNILDAHMKEYESARDRRV